MLTADAASAAVVVGTGGRGGAAGATPAGGGSTASAAASKSSVTVTSGGAQRATGAGAAAAGDYKAGDKVSHGKWGTGTVVSVKGSGNDTELQIAFPAPVGVKRLLAGFAPITKVE